MIFNSYQFTIEYHPDKKHGNADAMSQQRCENPVDCHCPMMEEDEQVLPCGPCKKCKRQAETMESGLELAEGGLHQPVEGPKELAISPSGASLSIQGTQTNFPMVRHVEETPEEDTYPFLMSAVTQGLRCLG